MKSMLSSKIRWLLVVPAIVLLLYIVIYIVFYSAMFSDYVFTKAEASFPGLIISNRQGSFSKGLHFDLRYILDDTELVFEKSKLKITPMCLLKMSFCIESIEINTLRLDLAKSKTETNPSAIVLPEIYLPIKLSIKNFHIRHLQITQDGKDLYSAEQIDVAVDLHGNDLELFKFSSADDFCRWTVSVNITLRQQYPLNAIITCSGKQRFGAVSLVLKGDLNQLTGKAEAVISGELVAGFIENSAKASLVFSLETLNPELLLNAELTIEEPVTLLSGDHSVVLSKSLMKIDGPLLQSVVNIENEFETSLWPGVNEFTAQFKLLDKSLDLMSLQLLLPKGQLNAEGKLTFSDHLRWQGETSWRDIDISQWQSAISGVISGRIINAISYKDEALLAEIKLLNIGGDLMGEALSGSGKLLWQNDELRIDDLAFKQNQNKLMVNGYYSPSNDSDISVELVLPEINQIVPEAQGELRAVINLSGNPDNLFVNAMLDAKSLTYSDLKIAQVQSHLSWYNNPQKDGDFSLSLAGFEKADSMYGNAELRGLGNINQHQFSLALDGREDFKHLAVSFSCGGSFGSRQLASFAQWFGECEQLNAELMLADQTQRWGLQSVINLEVQLQEKTMKISNFCLLQNEEKICNNETIKFSDGDIRALSLSGSELQIDWLKMFLNSETAREIEVMGNWDFTFTGNNLLTLPNVSAKIGSDHIQFAWESQNQTLLNVDFTTIDADWSWQDLEHKINWTLETKDSGSSSGELSLLDKNISGHASLKDFQLAQYSSFVFPNPKDQFAGQVNADVSLSGNLDFPLINGSVSLQGGEFVSTALPIPLSEIEMNLVVENSRATVIGSFQASEGSGQIGGEFNWQKDTWSGELNLKAKDFILQPNANSVVRFSPDLVFNMSPQHLVLSGEVLVPMARIVIKELPEQAVSTSPDTVIVGQEISSNEQTISTALKIVLGDDVRFTGFGLETRLSGDLNIRQEGDGILKGDGVVQLIEGGYKAYGQNLKINTGDLIFINDIENPQIRLEAIRANIGDDIEVGLRASGAASNPKIVLFSRPDMPRQEKFSYLLTGNPPGYDDGSEFDPAQAAAEVALSYALESNAGLSITRRAAETLGVKDLKVATSSGDNGTHLGLSGYLTPNLMVSYGVGVFDAVNTLTLDYRLRKNLTLEAISGESSALDLLWSFERD